MNTFEPSLIQLLLVGGLGSVIGYLLRRVQKFEEKRDEIYLDFLPSLNYGVYSFIELKNIFFYDSQLSTFIEKIGKINEKLEEKIFSGEMLFFGKNFQENLLDFYRDLRIFQTALEESKNSVDIEETIKETFKCGEDLLYTNPSRLLEKAEDIQDTILSYLRSYKSFSYYLIFVIFLLGVVIAAIEYFKM